MKPELLTERLVLRAYRAKDASVVSDAIEESRAALERWTPEIATRRSVTDVAAGLAGLQNAWLSRRKLVYGMFERSDECFVGEVGLYTIDWGARAATVGAWLRETARGRGLAREGFAALIGHAVHELGLERLDAHVHPANAHSRRLVEQVGLQVAGTVTGTAARFGSDGDVLLYRFDSAGGAISPGLGT